MALTMRILGPADVGEVPAFDFYAGEERVLKIQLIEADNEAPHPIPSGAVKTLTIHATPDDFDIADGSITIDAGDSSIFTVPITEAQSETMISGDLKFKYVTAGSVTRIATLENAMRLIPTSFCD